MKHRHKKTIFIDTKAKLLRLAPFFPKDVLNHYDIIYCQTCKQLIMMAVGIKRIFYPIDSPEFTPDAN